MDIEEKIAHLQEKIIFLRKKLIKLELERADSEPDVQKDVWVEFVRISHDLEKAEAEMDGVCGIILSDAEEVRSEIISTLEEYNRLRQQIHEIEGLFLANIVRPGYQLKLAIQQREKLESAYQKLLFGIQCEEFPSQEMLESEIRRVLTLDQATTEVQEELSAEEIRKAEEQWDYLWKSTADDVSEAIPKVDLIHEFKKVVLPKIHPDTSNTPVETFLTVYEALKKEDAVLMEGYIVMYQNDPSIDQQNDVLSALIEIKKLHKRYQRILVLLKHKLSRLKKDLSKQEVENPQHLRETMSLQREEILSRVKDEAEKILYWREKIEDLVKVYQDYH